MFLCAVYEVNSFKQPKKRTMIPNMINLINSVIEVNPWNGMNFRLLSFIFTTLLCVGIVIVLKRGFVHERIPIVQAQAGVVGAPLAAEEVLLILSVVGGSIFTSTILFLRGISIYVTPWSVFFPLYFTGLASFALNISIVMYVMLFGLRCKLVLSDAYRTCERPSEAYGMLLFNMFKVHTLAVLQLENILIESFSRFLLRWFWVLDFMVIGRVKVCNGIVSAFVSVVLMTFILDLGPIFAFVYSHLFALFAVARSTGKLNFEPTVRFLFEIYGAAHFSIMRRRLIDNNARFNLMDEIEQHKCVVCKDNKIEIGVHCFECDEKAFQVCLSCLPLLCAQAQNDDDRGALKRARRCQSYDERFEHMRAVLISLLRAIGPTVRASRVLYAISLLRRRETRASGRRMINENARGAEKVLVQTLLDNNVPVLIKLADLADFELRSRQAVDRVVGVPVVQAQAKELYMGFDISDETKILGLFMNLLAIFEVFKHSDAPAARVAVVYNFLAQNERLAKALQRSLNQSKEQLSRFLMKIFGDDDLLCAQSSSDDVEEVDLFTKLVSMITGVLGAGNYLKAKIVAILTLALSQEVFGEFPVPVQWFLKVAESFMSKVSGKAAEAISLTLGLIKHVYECIVDGDWDRLFNGDVESRWSLNVEKLVSEETKLLPEGTLMPENEKRYTAMTFVEACDSLLKEGERYVGSSRIPNPVRLRYMRILLDAKNSVLNTYLASQLRIQPFWVALYGLPGVGKTALSDHFHSKSCMVQGILGDPSSKYYRELSSGEFWPANVDMSTKTIIFDDAATTNVMENATHRLEAAALLINNAACPVNRAELSGKRNPFIAPSLVITSQNPDSIDMGKRLKDVTHWIRRISLCVEVTVDPVEFQRLTGTEYDPDKGLSSYITRAMDTRYLNRYVVRKVEVPCKQPSVLRLGGPILCEFRDRNEFLDFFETRFREHYAAQLEFVRRGKDGVCRRGMTLESHCGRPCDRDCNFFPREQIMPVLDLPTVSAQSGVEWWLNFLRGYLITYLVLGALSYGYLRYLWVMDQIRDTMYIMRAAMTNVNDTSERFRASMVWASYQIEARRQQYAAFNAFMKREKHKLMVVAGLLATLLMYRKMSGKQDSGKTMVDAQGNVLGYVPADLVQTERDRAAFDFSGRQKRDNVAFKQEVPHARPSVKAECLSVEELARKVKQNTFRVRCNRKMVHGFLLVPDVFVIPKHVFLRDGKYVAEAILDIMSDDQVLMRKVVDVHNLKPIVGTDLVCVTECGGLLGSGLYDYLTLDNVPLNYVGRAYVDGEFFPANAKMFVVNGLSEDGKHVQREGIRIDRTGVDGECGKPYIVTIGRVSAVGCVHIAGREGETYAEIVTRKMFDEVVALADVVQVQSTHVLERTLSTLQPLHERSVLDEVENPPYYVVGSVDRYTSTESSQVRKTPAYDYFRDDMLEACHEDFSPPFMRRGKLVGGRWVSPEILKFDQMKTLGEVPPLLLYNAALEYVGDYVFEKTQPTSLAVGYWGIPGNPDFPPLAQDTSSGPPYTRVGMSPKKKLSPGEYENQVLDPNFCADVWDIYMKLSESPIYTVYQYVRKDEPVAISKVEAGKTRVFSVCSASFNVVGRMLCLPIMAQMYKDKEFFEMYPGVNATSSAWDKLFRHIDKLPNWWEVDEKGFDSHHKYSMFLAVARVLSDVAARCGYDKDDQRRVKNVVLSCCYQAVIVRGDLMVTTTGLASGLFLTTILNCIAHSLLVRAYFAHQTGGALVFREHFKLALYGDDLLGSCSDECGCDQWSFRDTLRGFGYEVTSAHKNEELPRFADKSKATFLKRRFRLDDSLGCYVAPLDVCSLYKQLCWERRSKVITSEERLRDVYVNVCREAWLHGKEEFELWVLRCAVSARLVGIPVSLPGYDELFELFVSGSYRTWDI